MVTVFSCRSITTAPIGLPSDEALDVSSLSCYPTGKTSKHQVSVVLQAANVRRAPATRKRDLAAARVAALVAASKEAAEIARSASQQLNSLAESFKQSARAINDRKQRELA